LTSLANDYPGSRPGTQFFPPAERNQLLIDLELPTTASLTSMRETVDRISAQLKTHEEVATAAVFTGGTAPRFYYNVAPKEPASSSFLQPAKSQIERNGTMSSLTLFSIVRTCSGSKMPMLPGKSFRRLIFATGF